MTLREHIREIADALPDEGSVTLKAETLRSWLEDEVDSEPALEDRSPSNDDSGAPATWRSRIHRVHPDTRLTLAEVSEVLDCSERQVRRYLNGKTDAPELPHRKGPSGLTVRAEDLLTWIEDVEGANRFARAGNGR